MSDQIDQFGRDKSKPLSGSVSDDKSKKILETLAEIKNQLENKNYTPEVEINNNKLNKDIKSIRTKNLDFEQLHQRIEFLEEKLFTLANKVASENDKTKLDIEENIELEKSIFHNFGNVHGLNKGKSLLVLEDHNQSQIFKFKFYHFVFVTISLIIALILLTSYELKIGFLEIINIFFSNFN